ncbi:hypothetical protein LY78DRAFT_108814 [Colletotrichum sublineola]|nr:hypothetical protein LY78DRAFT_108814 [Colletotrichum sublineola]
MLQLFSFAYLLSLFLSLPLSSSHITLHGFRPTKDCSLESTIICRIALYTKGNLTTLTPTLLAERTSNLSAPTIFSLLSTFERASPVLPFCKDYQNNTSHNGRSRQAPRVRRPSPPASPTILSGLRVASSPRRPRRLRHPSSRTAPGPLLLSRPGDGLRPPGRPLPAPRPVSSGTIPSPGVLRPARRSAGPVPATGRLLPGQPWRRRKRHHGRSSWCARVLLLS